MLSQPRPQNSASPSSGSEPKPVRYGLIGAGMMGQEHIRNLALLDGASVTAIADPHEDMRQTAGRLAGDGCTLHGDHRALMAAGGFDALIVASPNHTHAPILRDILAADLPMLVEKPLCTTVEDCRDVIALQDRRSAPVWVAMEYRYMPPVQRLLEELKAGTAGTLRMIAMREHRFPFLDKVGGWNRFSAKSGGTLVEKCCHFFDLMRLMAGAEPVRVYASGAMDVNHLDEEHPDGRPDVIDNAFSVVDFDNGVRAMLDLCMFAEGSYWQETVAATGDRARVEAFVPGPARFQPGGKERMAEIAVSPRATKTVRRETVPVDETVLAAGDHHGATFFQHRHFIEMVRGNGTPQVGLEDGLKAVMMGAAAEQSARTGQAVDL